MEFSFVWKVSFALAILHEGYGLSSYLFVLCCCRRFGVAAVLIECFSQLGAKVVAHRALE